MKRKQRVFLNKLLAIMLAVIMMIPTNTIAWAAEDTFTDVSEFTLNEDSGTSQSVDEGSNVATDISVFSDDSVDSSLTQNTTPITIEPSNDISAFSAGENVTGNDITFGDGSTGSNETENNDLETAGLSGMIRVLYFYNMEGWNQVYASWSFDEEEYAGAAVSNQLMNKGMNDLWFVGIPEEADYIIFSDGTGNVYEEVIDPDSYYDLYADGWMNYESLMEASMYAGSWETSQEEGVTWILKVGTGEAANITNGELYSLLDQKWDTSEINYRYVYYGGFKYGDNVLHSQTMEKNALAGLIAGNTYNVYNATITYSWGIANGQNWNQVGTFKVVESDSKDTIQLKNGTSYNITINTQTYDGLRDAIIDAAVLSINNNTALAENAEVYFHQLTSGWNDYDTYTLLTDDNLSIWQESEDQNNFQIRYGTADSIGITITFTNNQLIGSYTINKDGDLNVPVNGYNFSASSVRNQSNIISEYILSEAISGYTHESTPIVELYDGGTIGAGWIEYSEVTVASYNNVKPGNNGMPVRIRWATTDNYVEMIYEFNVNYVESREAPVLSMSDNLEFTVNTIEDLKNEISKAITDIPNEAELAVTLSDGSLTIEGTEYTATVKITNDGANWISTDAYYANSGNDRTLQKKVIGKLATYTVKFVNAAGETITESTLPYGNSIIVPSDNPTKNSSESTVYTFAGWDSDTDEDEAIDASISTVTGNVVYSPVYTESAREYEISWEANGGKWNDEKTTVTTSVAYGTIPAQEAPLRTYYEFSGWNPEPYAVNGTASYAATWSPINDVNNNDIADEEEIYTIIYMDGEEKLKEYTAGYGEATPVYDYDNDASNGYQSPVKDGFNFKSWAPAWVGTVATPTEGATIIYTATWTELFAVNFMNRGNAYGDAQEIADGTTVTKPADPVWDENHDFLGWCVEGSSETFDFATPITGNLTLVANWREDYNKNDIEDSTENHFSVTYTDGVDNEEIFVDQVTENILINMPTPGFAGETVRNGYVFSGWDKEVEKVVTGDVTYIATWELDNNKNNVADIDETVIVKINVTGNGNVSVLGGTEQKDNGDGSYTVVYDSVAEGGNILSVEAIPVDTEKTSSRNSVSLFTVDGADVVNTNPYPLTISDDKVYEIVVEFVYTELKLNSGTTIYVNKNATSDRITGLKEKVLAKVVEGYANNPENYKVVVDATFNYDLDDLGGLDTVGLSTALTYATGKFVITDLSTGLYGTVEVSLVDSRESLTITASDVTVSAYAETDLATSVADQVKAAVSIKSTNPQTAEETVVAVSDSYITYKPSYVWPADGKTETFEVTVRVNSYANETYSNAPSATLTLTVTDTTPLYSVTYVDGDENDKFFADQVYAEVAENTEIPSYKVKVDDALVEGNPSNDLYDFIEWNLTSGTVNEDGTIGSDLIYTAQWAPKLDNNGNGIADQEETYIVEYVDKDELGTVVSTYASFEGLKYGDKTPVYDADKETAEIELPTKEGYNFVGWDVVPADVITAPTSGNTITYTATWTELWVVSFEGHTYKTPATIENGEKVTEPVDTWDENHDFLGWFEKDATDPFDFETEITGNVTLTAKWIEDYNHNDIDDATEDHFTVTYVVDGVETKYENILVGLTTPTYDENDATVNPSKENYKFNGWDPEVAETVTADVTYTAQWLDDVNNNGVADIEETITINIAKANDNDSVSITGAVKANDESESSYVFDSTGNKTIKIVATPVTNAGVPRKSVTYIASVEVVEVAEPAVASENGESSTEDDGSDSEEDDLAAFAEGTGVYGDDFSYTYEFTASNKQNITVTFKEAGFVLNAEREMNYYDGMKDVKNEDVYNTIVDTPEYADATEYTIQYKAREAMSQTVQLSSLGLSDTILNILNIIGVNEFKFDLPELWLDVNVETEGKVKDSVPLDTAVSQYLTAEKIEGLWDTFKAAADANGGVILGAGAGYEAVKGEIAQIYENVYAAAMYYDAHNFGYNNTAEETVTEEIKITYKNAAMYIETETDITLRDMRETSYVAGNNVSVMYRDYTDEDLVKAIGAYVTDAQGNVIEGASATSLQLVDPYTFEGSYASDTAYELVFKFAGNELYKPSEATFTVNVTKAPAAIDLPNVNVVYGESYSVASTVTLENKYGDSKEVTDSMIQFIIGLDVADLDVNADGVTGLNSKIQLILPEELQSMLNGILGATGGSIEDGAEMSLSDLAAMLETIDDGSVSALTQALESIQNITETGDITIVIGGEYPTDTGAYLYGAVSTSSNYTTAYDIAYIIIKPNATQVYLDWNYSDSNGVFTHELLQHVDFGAAAYDDAAFNNKNNDASAVVQSLIFGIDASGNVVTQFNETDELANGAYTQLAFIAEFGNEMYYAVPIVRAFVVMPNVVEVEIIDAEGTDFKRTFDNHEQDVDVEVTYTQGGLIEPSEDNLTITYTGIQTNTQTYNETTAPLHAGIYLVTATYMEKDENGNVIAIGMDVETMTVIPADATVTVENEIIEYSDVNHKFSDYISVETNSGVTSPDMTIISAAIASTGDFSENGWKAVEGRVNFDFPQWVDDLFANNEAYKNGTTVGELAEILKSNEGGMTSLLEGLGLNEKQISSVLPIMEAVLGEAASILEQMPTDMELSFDPDATFKSVGAYVTIGIVTDSDHIPAMDAGMIVVVPAVTETELKWNYEDENEVWTRELLEHVDLYATAYDVETSGKNEEATAMITYQFIGFDKEGNLVVTDNFEKVPNGIFAEVAYIELEVGGEMVISNMISRIIAIVPGVAEVNFVDESGAVNNDRSFSYDDTAKEMDVRVTINGEEIVPAEGTLTVTYRGVLTNGTIYNSTEAPINSGVYVATAEYTDHVENGSVAHYGMAIGAMVIKPVEATIEVTGKTVEYDGKAYSAVVATTSPNAEDVIPDYTLISGNVNLKGNIDEVGAEAFAANVNIDFPEWLDDVLEETEFKKEGVTAAYLIDFMESYIDDALNMIPTETLIQIGVAEEDITAAVDRIMAVYNQVLSVLELMPESVSITFDDNVTYTEPGYYLYYGIVTDSDHIPSADTGLLVIEKLPYKYALLDTYVPYNGEGQVSDTVCETMEGEALTTDAFTMIVDRAENIVTLQLDADMMYLVDKIEKLTGYNLQDGVPVSSLYEEISVEKLAELVMSTIEKVKVEGLLDTENELYKVMELLETELESLPTDGQFVISDEDPVDVGTYEVYSIAYSEHYETQISKSVLNILPIYISIDDIDNSKVYGETDPELTTEVVYYSYAGGEYKYWLDGKDWVSDTDTYDVTNDENYDNKVVIDAAELPEDIGLVVEVVREEGEDVGIYDMTVNAEISDVSGNYILNEIVQDAEDFEITPAPITITVADETKVYGDEDPEFTYEITEGTLASWDNIAFELVREAGEDVGEYVITVVTVDENGNTLYPNYDIAVEDGTFEITKKAVTLTVADAEKVYGETDPESFAYTVETPAFDDEIVVTPVRAEGENVGEYVITVAEEELNAYTNYDIELVDGKFEIIKKAVTLTVADAEKVYGETDPESFAYTVETPAFDDEIVVTPVRAEGENVGEYVITAVTTDNEGKELYPNYEITVVDGTFTIVKRDVEVTIIDASKVYRETDPEGYAGFEVDNLVGEDQLVVEITRTNEDETVGTYEDVLVADAGKINADEANSNYNVTSVVPGDFTILVRELTIVGIEAQNRTYEDDNKEITVIVTVKGMDPEDPEATTEITSSANIAKDDAAIYTGIRNLVLGLPEETAENYSYEITPDVVDMMWEETVEILPVEIEAVMSDAVKTKVYDGTRSIVEDKDSVLTMKVAGGQTLPEDLTITYNYGAYKDKNAGETSIAIGGIHLVAAEGSELNLNNYKVVETVIRETAEITAKKAEIKFKDLTIPYTTDTGRILDYVRNPENGCYEITGLIESDSVEDVVEFILAEKMDGEYIITAEGINPNYELPSILGNLAFSERELRVTVQANAVPRVEGEQISVYGDIVDVEGFDLHYTVTDSVTGEIVFDYVPFEDMKMISEETGLNIIFEDADGKSVVKNPEVERFDVSDEQYEFSIDEKAFNTLNEGHYEIVVNPYYVKVVPRDLTIVFKDNLVCEIESVEGFLQDITNTLTAETIDDVINLPYLDYLEVVMENDDEGVIPDTAYPLDVKITEEGPTGKSVENNYSITVIDSAGEIPEILLEEPKYEAKTKVLVRMEEITKTYDGERELGSEEVADVEFSVHVAEMYDDSNPEASVIDGLEVTAQRIYFIDKNVGEDKEVIVLGLELSVNGEADIELEDYELVSTIVEAIGNITPAEVKLEGHYEVIPKWMFNGENLDDTIFEAVDTYLESGDYSVEGIVDESAIDSVVEFAYNATKSDDVFEITINSIDENYVTSTDSVQLTILPCKIAVFITSETGEEISKDSYPYYEVVYGEAENFEDFELRYTLVTPTIDGNARVLFEEELTYEQLVEYLGVDGQDDYRCYSEGYNAVEPANEDEENIYYDDYFEVLVDENNENIPYVFNFNSEKFNNNNDAYEIMFVQPCETYILPLELTVTFKEELKCEADEVEEYLSDVTNLFTVDTIDRILDLPYGDGVVVSLGEKWMMPQTLEIDEYGMYELNADIYDGSAYVGYNYILNFEPYETPVIEVTKPTIENPVEVIAVMSPVHKEYDGSKEMNVDDVEFKLYERYSYEDDPENAEEITGFVVNAKKVIFDDENVAYDEEGKVTSMPVIAMGLELNLAEDSDKDLEEYKLTSTYVEGEGTINPKPITITGLEVVDRSYVAGNTVIEVNRDNAEFANVSSDEEEIIIEGDTVDFTVEASLDDPTKEDDDEIAANAGDSKPVYLSIELNGADKDNYSIVVPTDLTVNIGQALIEKVDLGEITRPSRNTVPQAEITVDDSEADYSVELVWEDENGTSLAANATFEQNHVYTAKVTLSLKDSANYAFADTLTAGTEGWVVPVDADGKLIVDENGSVTLTKEYSIKQTNVLASSIETENNTTGIGVQTLVNLNATSADGKAYWTGDTVTATAVSDGSGVYAFKGWYSGNDNGPDYGKMLSSNAEYKFVVEEDIHLWAVYEALEKVKLIIHGPEFTISTINGVVQTDEYIGYYNVGTKITVTGVYDDEDDDRFLYWKNDSEKMVSKSVSYTFTIVRDTILNVVNNTSTSEGFAKVEFISYTDQVLNVANYVVGQTVEFPRIIPSKTGYEFAGWSMDEQAIWDAIASGETFIRIEPVYEFLAIECKLNVTFDSTFNPTKEEDTIVIGEIHTVNAKTIDGRKFSHWSDNENGSNILSTSSKYSFMVTGDMNLYAIYVGEDEEVVKLPTISILDASVQSGTSNKLSFTIVRDVPEGYDLILQGALFSTSSEYAGDDAAEKMIDGASGVTTAKSKDLSKAGIYTINFTVGGSTAVNNDTIVHVRGYMYVYNQKTGMYEVIYSNIESGSYNTLNK